MSLLFPLDININKLFSFLFFFFFCVSFCPITISLSCFVARDSISKKHLDSLFSFFLFFFLFPSFFFQI